MLDYEVFIEEIIDGPTPTVFAALLCRSDGFKVFHARRFGMRLVPDWPMPPGAFGPVKILAGTNDVRGDQGALLACGRGMPSDAFGALYAPFDGTRRAPRLPDEPYHFMSRVLSVSSPPGVPTKGGTVVAEYDVPPGEWYFGDAHVDVVPMPVLIEILLQPCGWLSSYNGFAANRPDDVVFRNLDGGDVVQRRPARVGTLRVTSTLERFADGAGSTIVFFDVVCTQDDEVVMTMKTAFGFFSPEALKNQVGLRTEAGALEALSAPAPVVVSYRAAELDGAPWLDQGRLQVLDRVNFWPDGGGRRVWAAGRRVRRDPGGVVLQGALLPRPGTAWFVGSGSHAAGGARCGTAIRSRRTGEDFEFEPVALDQMFSWKFRGQVTPTNKRTRSEIEILSTQSDDRGVLVVFDGQFC